MIFLSLIPECEVGMGRPTGTEQSRSGSDAGLLGERSRFNLTAERTVDVNSGTGEFTSTVEVAKEMSKVPSLAQQDLIARTQAGVA